jgi:uncharacterized protein (DUF302 family)
MPHDRKPADVVEVRSMFALAETIDRLDSEITTRGLQVFARIDHAANAREVGLDMPPTTVVIFGNARGGTPLMIMAPAMALDLPLRVLVRQNHTEVVVSYHDPVALVAAFELSPSDAAPLQAVSAIVQAAAREQHSDRDA